MMDGLKGVVIIPVTKLKYLIKAYVKTRENKLKTIKNYDRKYRKIIHNTY